jgi:hypothetical protein
MTVASTIQILEVDLDNHFDLKRPSMKILTLPHLTYLAIHGPSPLAAIGFTHQLILSPPAYRY